MRKTAKDKRKLLVDATRQMNNGKYAEAERVLSHLLSAYPGDPEVCRTLATLHLKRGQLQVALSEIKFLATAAMRAQDYALAQSMIEEYLQVDPNCAPLMILMGEVYEEKGDRAAALAQYVRTIDLLVTRPDPEYPDLPRELLEKVTSLSPDQATLSRLTAAVAAMEAPPPEQPPQAAGDSPVVSLDSEDYRQLVAAPSARSPLRIAPSEPAEPAVEEAEWADPAASEPAVDETAEPADATWTAPPSDPQDHDPVAEPPTAPVWSPPEPDPPLPALQAAADPAETAWTPEAIEPPIADEGVGEERAPAMDAEPSASRYGGGGMAVVSAPVYDDAADVEVPRRRRKPARKKPATDYRAWYLRSRLSRWVKKTKAAAALTGRLAILCLLTSVALPVLAVLGVTITWIVLEEKPSPTFQSLAAMPAPHAPDPKRNGYFLLLGLGEPPAVDPMRAGYERWQQVDVRRRRCLDPREERERALLAGADAEALSDWVGGSAPVLLFEQERATLSYWASRNEVLLARYERWLTMPFEDAGYGTTTSLDCAQLLAVHRLYLAAGFAQGDDEGIARLELDLAGWRNVMAKARTLTTKRLAMSAVNDDTAVLSDLLARPDLEMKHLPRLTRLTQPLSPAERSLKAAMHDEFLAYVRLRERGIQAEDIERPLVVQAATRLPLPKQRSLNGHAAYYEALMQVSDARPVGLPSLYDFVRTPPHRWLDYLTNPVDNLVNPGGVPPWDDYAGMITETDARLRLAGLQAHLRVPSRHAFDLLGRIAEAGPRFYDPFTDLPMLTNPAKTVLYSIGRDRADNNGDPRLDVVVPVFLAVPAF